LAVAAALTFLLGIPGLADAIPIPGPNGRLAFTSGRGGAPNVDTGSDIYLFAFPGGPAVQFTNTGAVQDSHPAWSADRTKIAYSVGPDGTRDIVVQDVATGTVTPFVNTAANEDRPAFSPDGTRIAWTSGTDILIAPLAGGPTITLTDTVATPADKAAWTPDSQTIYYSAGDIATNAADIYKEPSNNSAIAATPVLTTAAVDEWQPAISPDGSKLCYTRGPKSSAAQVYTVAATGAGAPGVNFSNTAAAVGAINCVWSPDGTKIAYTRGTFTAGELGYQDANTPGPGSFVPLSDSAMHFDGNADWARNPGPTCTNASVTTGFNTAASISLSCSDPAPENDSTAKSIVSGPAHGSLGTVQAGQPAKVVYTPAANFSGTDSFKFKGNDGTSDSAPATVTVTVNAPPPPPKDTVAATISSVTVSPSTWRVGSLLPAFSRRRAHVGTTIGFSLNEDATVTLTFAKATIGRKVGRICKARTRANRNKRHCTRYVTKGSITRSLKSGQNKLAFQGRISSSKRLGTGRYRVTIGAVDVAGNVSIARTAFFTIVR